VTNNPYNPYFQQGMGQQGNGQEGNPQQGVQQYPQQQYPQQQYPQQGFPQQGFPQQGFPQQGFPQQGFPQQGFPQQGFPQQGFQPPMLSQIPNYVMPTQQMVGAFQATRQINNGINFVKFLGPRGEEKWDSVPIRHKSVVRAYLLPPYAEGRNIFSISKKHFWKSFKSPRGTSIACIGAPNCKICLAKQIGLDSGNPELQKRAKEFGAIRTTYLYNVALLDNIPGHFDSGIPKPFVLTAGATLHTAIGNLIEDKGITICDPQQGRPIRLKKEKTGPNQMDIDYHATDEEPSPLPQVLWSLLANLVDLDQLVAVPKDEDVLAAISDMGLSLDNGSVYQVPNNYNSMPLMPQNVMYPYLQNQNPPPVMSSNNVGGNYYPQPSQMSQNQMPQNPMPQNPMPQNPMPQNPMPQNPMPQNPMPQNQMPQNPMPQNPMPQNPMPQNQMPQNQMPQNQMPQNQMPQNQMPQNQMPQNQMPQNKMVQNPMAQNPVRNPVSLPGNKAPLTLEELQRQIAGR
jgi:hypothetical protein